MSTGTKQLLLFFHLARWPLRLWKIFGKLSENVSCLISEPPKSGSKWSLAWAWTQDTDPRFNVQYATLQSRQQIVIKFAQIKK